MKSEKEILLELRRAIAKDAQEVNPDSPEMVYDAIELNNLLNELERQIGQLEWENFQLNTVRSNLKAGLNGLLQRSVSLFDQSKSEQDRLQEIGNFQLSIVCQIEQANIPIDIRLVQ